MYVCTLCIYLYIINYMSIFTYNHIYIYHLISFVFICINQLMDEMDVLALSCSNIIRVVANESKLKQILSHSPATKCWLHPRVPLS